MVGGKKGGESLKVAPRKQMGSIMIREKKRDIWQRKEERRAVSWAR